MELGNRCPFCGGSDCKKSPSVNEIWIGSDALYFFIGKTAYGVLLN